MLCYFLLVVCCHVVLHGCTNVFVTNMSVEINKFFNEFACTFYAF